MGRFSVYIGIFLRGCAMGAADLVPGVSGGTIALITGIYERLINAIASIDMSASNMALKGDIKGAWKHIDGSFLLALALGILTTIALLAHLIEHLVESQPVLLWAFFCGLILASIMLLIRMLPKPDVVLCICIALGALLAFWLAQIRAAELPVTWIFIFFGGFIAISAMMLPGISGSFLLLMLGLYQPTLQAITELNLVYVAIFAAGVATGFIVFSRVIRYLLAHFKSRMLYFLTGLLIGSLSATWPWKIGLLDQLATVNVMPSTYASLGLDAQFWTALIYLVAGFILVSVIAYAGARTKPTDHADH